MAKEIISRFYEDYQKLGLSDLNVFFIDENLLDKENVNQPKFCFEIAALLADAKRAVEEQKGEIDVLKSKVEEAESELDLAIRKNPKMFGFEKTTENGIKATILIHPTYKNAKDKLTEAQARLIELKHAVDICEGAMKAIDHRKAGIEGLIYLHGQNYFSTPRTGTPLSEEVLDEARTKRMKNSRKVEQNQEIENFED